MREITVKYMLTKEQEERLKNITGKMLERYNPDAGLTEEKMFNLVMLMGCEFDIERRFDLHEKILLGEKEDVRGSERSPVPEQRGSVKEKLTGNKERISSENNTKDRQLEGGERYAKYYR